MKTNIVFRIGLCLCSAFTILSCSDEEIIGRAGKTENYEIATTTRGYVRKLDDEPSRLLEMRSDVDTLTDIYFGVTCAQSKALAITFAYDPQVLKAYNAKHGTDFEIYPETLVNLEAEGDIYLIPGKRRTDPIRVFIKSSNSLTTGKTYALPIKATTEDPKVFADYILWVKCMGQNPDTRKSTGIQTVWYMTDNTNILNAKEWTLAKSGKPVADMVCLFSANINWDPASKRVYVVTNEKITAWLENRDHYIKPLQDMGIKVTLSILNNWDHTGVANLAPETAKAFARELKRYMDAYGLDGVTFDDEYAAYPYDPPIGFVDESPEAFARLCYECKVLMPDKIIGVYQYGNAYSGFRDPVEGVDPGEFIDQVYESMYGGLNSGITQSFRGMTNKQVSPYSRKLDWGWSGNYETFKEVRDEGYGLQMLYAYQIGMLHPGDTGVYEPDNNFNKNHIGYLKGMNEMCLALFDEEVVWSGIEHKKDF